MDKATLDEGALLEFARGPAGRAVIELDCSQVSPHRVSPLLYSKFCEHLGYNIYQGQEAQILYNPTFGKIKVAEQWIRDGLAPRQGWPNGERVVADYLDGAALGWFRVGAKEQVRLSADVAPNACQAQRVETPGAAGGGPLGIEQWTYLPLWRTRGYEYRVVARAYRPARIRLAIAPADQTGGSAGPLVAEAMLELTEDWQTFTGRLEIDAAAKLDPRGLFLVSLTSDEPANFVLGRVLLYPDDHIDHWDPEIVALHRRAKLPLLRWPGGNFVSGYHWRDGVGPPDLRPTTPNPVWHGTFESNLVGTDEFVMYCRAVGCAPMICVNFGDGSADEAGAWVEYCNGGPESPMGRLRAENGHPEPYRIRYWEIGNEIFGRHQIGWTTPEGHVDRYKRFARAMRAADPTIRVLACGGLHLGVDVEWNRVLIAQAGDLADCHTHHILEGGDLPPTTDPEELYHAFMGYPVAVAADYRLMRQRMSAGGIRQPRLAITELMLFATIRKQADALPPERPIGSPNDIAEALYATLMIHECARLGELVEMVTHSATVNHGGGLRKSRQRVWANPVHYAHELGVALAGGRPVKVRLSCGTFSTQHTFGHLPLVRDCPDLDALAVLHDDGSLVLMLVHRSAHTGPLPVTIRLGDFPAGASAEVVTLQGDSLADHNTMEDPARVAPRESSARVEQGQLTLTVAPFSLTRIRVARR